MFFKGDYSMKKLYCFLFYLCFFCISELSTVGGNGGPISAICSLTNIENINKYIFSEASIPAFDQQYCMLGEIGTTWPMKNFGLGFSVLGGSQISLRADFQAYATL